jgi:hypothetical protein
MKKKVVVFARNTLYQKEISPALYPDAITLLLNLIRNGTKVILTGQQGQQNSTEEQPGIWGIPPEQDPRWVEGSVGPEKINIINKVKPEDLHDLAKTKDKDKLFVCDNLNDIKNIRQEGVDAIQIPENVSTLARIQLFQHVQEQVLSPNFLQRHPKIKRVLKFLFNPFVIGSICITAVALFGGPIGVAVALGLIIATSIGAITYYSTKPKKLTLTPYQPPADADHPSKSESKNQSLTSIAGPTKNIQNDVGVSSARTFKSKKTDQPVSLLAQLCGYFSGRPKASQGPEVELQDLSLTTTQIKR